jgi:hypothetical protein
MVAATLALRRGGRLAFVLPGELLQAGYARGARRFLAESFSSLRVIEFHRLVVDGVRQNVVLLLGERGSGPARVEIIGLGGLDDLTDRARSRRLPRSTLVGDETWTRYVLRPEEHHAFEVAVESGGVRPLSNFARVDIGVLTGNNDFFSLCSSDALALGLEQFCVPFVRTASAVTAMEFRDGDFAALEAGGKRTRLLAVPPTLDPSEHADLARYLARGESRGVHQGFKCARRARWWSVPSTWRPDAFLTRHSWSSVRVIANSTAATSSVSLHRLRVSSGVDVRRLAAASLNTVTALAAELAGTSHGHGALELHTAQAEALPLPDYSALGDADVSRIDALVRRRRIAEARELADNRLLGDALGLDAGTVKRLQGALNRMQARRTGRWRRA